MYKLRILEQAAEDIKNIDRAVAHRIVTKIRWLAENIEKITPAQLKGNLSDLCKLGFMQTPSWRLSCNIRDNPR